REFQNTRPPRLSIDWEHGKAGHMNAVIGEDLFGKRFIMCQGQSARIAARVRLFHQLKVADHVLIIDGIAMEFLKQIKCDVRLMLFKSLPNDPQVAVKTNRIDLMTHALER